MPDIQLHCKNKRVVTILLKSIVCTSLFKSIAVPERSIGNGVSVISTLLCLWTFNHRHPLSYPPILGFQGIVFTEEMRGIEQWTTGKRASEMESLWSLCECERDRWAASLPLHLSCTHTNSISLALSPLRPWKSDSHEPLS